MVSQTLLIMGATISPTFSILQPPPPRFTDRCDHGRRGKRNTEVCTPKDASRDYPRWKEMTTNLSSIGQYVLLNC